MVSVPARLHSAQPAGTERKDPPRPGGRRSPFLPDGRRQDRGLSRARRVRDRAPAAVGDGCARRRRRRHHALHAASAHPRPVPAPPPSSARWSSSAPTIRSKATTAARSSANGRSRSAYGWAPILRRTSSGGVAPPATTRRSRAFDAIARIAGAARPRRSRDVRGVAHRSSRTRSSASPTSTRL